MAVLGLTGEVDGYIYLGQQTRVLRQAGGREPRAYGMCLLPPFFGGLDGATTPRPTSRSTARTPGRPVLSQVAGRPALLQAFRREIFRNDLCNADVDLGDLLIHEAPPRRRRFTRPKCSAPTRRTSC